MKRHDDAPLRVAQRRFNRSQEKWRRETNALDAPVEDPRLQRVNVEENIREFGQW
jgi:uncharacterized protein (DUF1778 family)